MSVIFFGFYTYLRTKFKEANLDFNINSKFWYIFFDQKHTTFLMNHFLIYSNIKNLGFL